MYNIISITEDRNKIYISGDYQKIICGNTNYYFKFTFDKEWSEVENKTAIFEVLGKKILVEFKGDICNIPSMPNASYFLLSLTCAPNKNESYCSNAIKLELERNTINEELQIMDPFISYYSRLKSIVDEIESRTIINVTDISNPNYLINPDMSINQKKKTFYSGINTYATDRWKLKSDYSFVEQNIDGTWSVGIQNTRVSEERSIISQSIEDFKMFKGKTVTVSFKYKSIDEIIPNTTYIAINDGISKTEVPLNVETNFTVITKTIDLNATTLEVELKTDSNGEDVTIIFDWCKLELGNYPTMFIPRFYAEELALCQRYYQTVYLYGNGCSYSNTASIYCPVPLPVKMRVRPTITVLEEPIIVGNSTTFEATEVTVQKILDNVCMLICRSGSNGSFIENNIYSIYDGVITLDAEIY